jgi:hypothetical protein
MTISMLSNCRGGTEPSATSDFIGVIGGVESLNEYELVRDLERDMEDVEPVDLEIERNSDVELAMWAPSRSATRRELTSSAVKNWRISLLRFSRSSLVRPRVCRSWEMGDI